MAQVFDGGGSVETRMTLKIPRRVEFEAHGIQRRGHGRRGDGMMR